MGIKNLKLDVNQDLVDRWPGSVVLDYDNVFILGETAVMIAVDRLWSPFSLFPNGNRGMPIGILHWRDAARDAARTGALQSVIAHAGLVKRQMHDGRRYLQGDDPSLADVHAAAWMLEPDARRVITEPENLIDWRDRMQAFVGAGKSPTEAPLSDLNLPQTKPTEVVLHPLNTNYGDSLFATLLAADSDLQLMRTLRGQRIMVSALDFDIRGRQEP